MVKPWCASSAHAPDASAERNRPFRPLLAALALASVAAAALPAAARADDAFSQLPPAAAATTPGGTQAPSPTPTPTPTIDPSFLMLPAFDVERAAKSQAQAQAQAQPQDGAVKVGDQVTLRVAGINLPGINDPATQLKLAPAPGGESLEDQGWELLPAPSDAKAAPGELLFSATPLKPGRATLPSLALVPARDTAGKAVARTNPFTLDVESAIKKDDPKPEQPADLRPPLSLRFPWWVIAAAAILAALALAAAVYGVRRYLANRKPVETPKPVEPPKPEDEVALAALAELERRGPLKKGEFKAHYFRVSEVLKEYLGRRYRFDAVESTTRELINHLEERKQMADQWLDRLESLFDKLDLVKFTDHVPLPDEGGKIVADARELVLATRRPPEVVSAPGGAAGGAGPSAGKEAGRAL